MMLWSKSKKLLTIGEIKRVYISNGTIRIKISENSSPLSITQDDDFRKHFPDIDLSSSKIRLNKYTFLCSNYCCCVLLLFIVSLYFLKFSVSLATTISNFFCITSTLFKCLFVLALPYIVVLML